MTQRLFWINPYLKECDSKITEIQGDKVYLDKTVFFAFSGGQEADAGTISGINVREAVDEGKEIYYILDRHEFKPTDRVTVRINWDRRYKLMRLHSATHVVYAAFEEKFGRHETIGSNISPEKGRLDFELKESITPLLPELQRKANEMIDKNLDIKTGFVDVAGTERYWKMGDFSIPCGGTHVKNTKEIGKVLLKRKNIGSSKERIEIYLA